MLTRTKPKALDLFCCAGGAGMGLWQAGFEVFGVDIKPQPRYPFAFIQADALAFPLEGYDFIWASPPCQNYSITKALFRGQKRAHRSLIRPIRRRLAAQNAPYVIENVMGAPLRDPIMLCGTMFGLRVYRHRIFECSFQIQAPEHPKHTHGSTGSHRGYSRGNPMVCVAGHNFKKEEGEIAMGIDWMTSRAQLAQAIPPAYAKFIGEAAMAHIKQTQDVGQLELLRDKLSGVQGEIEGERARLRSIQMRCSHPNKFATCCMGDSGWHCPDCGWSV